MMRIMARARRAPVRDAVEAFAAVADRFATTVAWADMRASVAACPGWSVYDLVVHLGNTHAWAATIMETGARAPAQNDAPRWSRARSVSSWYEGKAEDLYRVLREFDPERPCWNFVSGTGVGDFWPRRQLHETTIHLVDLDTTRHQPTEVEPVVAADGIAEVLTVLLSRRHRAGRPTRLSAPLAVTATDTDETWVVRPDRRASALPAQPVDENRVAAPPVVEHRDAPDPSVGDRIEGPATAIYRRLWHRAVAEGELALSGERTRIRAFLDSALTP